MIQLKFSRCQNLFNEPNQNLKLLKKIRKMTNKGCRTIENTSGQRNKWKFIDSVINIQSGL